MSPSRKQSPKKSRPSHTRKRHAPPVEESAPVVASPPVDAMHLLTEACTAAGGILPRDLVAWIQAAAPDPKRPAPGIADRMLTAIFDALPPDVSAGEVVPWIESVGKLPAEWRTLGAQLAERPHRLALALHVATAATSGGGKLTAAQEDALADQFLAIVDEGIALTGGVQPDAHRKTGQRNPYAEAVWYLLHCQDWIRDARHLRPPRCPAMAAQEDAPGEEGFVDQLRAAVPGYVRTVIAGADDDEIDDLVKLLVMGEHALDEQYRPFGTTYTEDVPHGHMERALEQISRRFATPEQTCDAVEAWGSAFDAQVVDHDIPPVNRIGALVWLARVGCRATGGAQ